MKLFIINRYYLNPMEFDDDEIGLSGKVGEEPPDVSIGLLIKSFRTRGINATLEDENIGPHSHLFLLLCLVFLISILIGTYVAIA
jgi:hypothetical protein